MDNSRHYAISARSTARTALEHLDKLPALLTVFLVDENRRLVGTLTDGDIRRGLLRGLSLEAPAMNFARTEFRYLAQGKYTLADVNALKQNKIHIVPLLDSAGRIVRLIDLTEKRSALPVDALIMAGGRGSRLRPLTDTVPKPLLKIGGTPIIERNIERLRHFGVYNINISLRYLGEQLVDYFSDGKDRNLNIGYVWEEEALGTAGALRLVESFEHDTILLMNSDLLTDIDFEEMVEAFEAEQADMMVACIPYEVNVPYAIMEIDDERVKGFKEKPTYTYYANAGIYLLKRDHLSIIPGEGSFDATDLMQGIIKRGLKLAYFPILGYWLDIGKPQDYEKAQRDVIHLQL